ncbi:hypothetical protein FB451DRAFT_1467325 [Mycena latifolia]|nr:hypothetical protein FB451DRAFT_1467325 [Mycena latifolia]
MSRSAHPSKQDPQRPPRRRTVMACSNCRKRKIRCITSEDFPTNPCARCIKRGMDYLDTASDSLKLRLGRREAPTLSSSGPPPLGRRSRGAEYALPLPSSSAPPGYSYEIYPDLMSSPAELVNLIQPPIPQYANYPQFGSSHIPIAHPQDSYWHQNQVHAHEHQYAQYPSSSSPTQPETAAAYYYHGMH